MYINWYKWGTTDDSIYRYITTDNTSDTYLDWITVAPIYEPEEPIPEKVGDLGEYDFRDLPKEELEKWV